MGFLSKALITAAVGAGAALLFKVSAEEKEKKAEEAKRTAYQQAVMNFHKNAYAAPKQFQVKKSEGLSYGVGDRVRHMKFGEGTVTQITEGGRDYEVTVQFDTAGVKKMFAMFAKLEKVE